MSATVRIDIVGYFLGATAPPAPTQVGASAGDRQAVVSWTPPQTNGGSAISGYTVTSSPDGKTATAPAGATTATVTGLTNGVDYRFAVRAVNAVGTSAASAASPPVTPAAAQPPGRPFVTEVYPRDGALRVNWSPPDTGPLSVSGYTLSATVVGASTPAATLQVGPNSGPVGPRRTWNTRRSAAECWPRRSPRWS